MNVLLIQLPDTHTPLRERPLSRHILYPFAISWDLLCLDSYLKGHTRHHCHIVDFRIANDLEKALNEELRQLPNPGIAVVYCEAANLGNALTLLNLIRKTRPKITTAICGPFSSAYPTQAYNLNLADYCISGDPEPILRNLLDFIDVPQRLRNTPGLQLQGHPAKAAYWLPRLETLSLPNWKDIFWAPYQNAGKVRATARLSRGNAESSSLSSYYNGNSEEPLREWRFEDMAISFRRCTHAGISLVHLLDPPHFWTDTRLNRWCTTLRNTHNTQDWQLQLTPRALSAEQIDALTQACCRRIDFTIPSAHPEIAEKYSFSYDPHELAQTIQRLSNFGIDSYVRLRVGGPYTTPDEVEYTLQTAKYFGIEDVILEPFPFIIESLAFRAPHSLENETLAALMKWLKDPWTTDKPVLFWGGEIGVSNTSKAMEYIHRTLSRNAGRLLAQCWKKISATQFIHYLEDKAIGLLIRRNSVAKNQ